MIFSKHENFLWGEFQVVVKISFRKDIQDYRFYSRTNTLGTRGFFLRSAGCFGARCETGETANGNFLAPRQRTKDNLKEAESLKNSEYCLERAVLRLFLCFFSFLHCFKTVYNRSEPHYNNLMVASDPQK